MTVARFNIAEILWSLKQTQLQFRNINVSLNVRRTPLTSDAIHNLVEGYRFVDQLLADGIDLLAIGHSKHLLELNTLVLCGSDSHSRKHYSSHIQHSSDYFYDASRGAIGDVIEWYAKHRSENLWRRVAGIYIQIMSRPQLFIEGNHRSAILVVSYLLGREGYPPFVLTPANARVLLDESREINDLRKNSLRMLMQYAALRNRLATTFKHHLERRHSLVNAGIVQG